MSLIGPVVKSLKKAASPLTLVTEVRTLEDLDPREILFELHAIDLG